MESSGLAAIAQVLVLFRLIHLKKKLLHKLKPSKKRKKLKAGKRRARRLPSKQLSSSRSKAMMTKNGVVDVISTRERQTIVLR